MRRLLISLSIALIGLPSSAVASASNKFDPDFARAVAGSLFGTRHQTTIAVGYPISQVLILSNVDNEDGSGHPLQVRAFDRAYWGLSGAYDISRWEPRSGANVSGEEFSDRGRNPWVHLDERLKTFLESEAPFAARKSLLVVLAYRSSSTKIDNWIKSKISNKAFVKNPSSADCAIYSATDSDNYTRATIVKIRTKGRYIALGNDDEYKCILAGQVSRLGLAAASATSLLRNPDAQDANTSGCVLDDAWDPKHYRSESCYSRVQRGEIYATLADLIERKILKPGLNDRSQIVEGVQNWMSSGDFRKVLYFRQVDKRLRPRRLDPYTVGPIAIPVN